MISVPYMYCSISFFGIFLYLTEDFQIFLWAHSVPVYRLRDIYILVFYATSGQECFIFWSFIQLAISTGCNQSISAGNWW